MAKNRGVKSVKQGREELTKVLELSVAVWESVVNNQDSPIDLMDMDGKSVIILEPHGSILMTDDLRNSLGKSEYFKNLVNRGIVSIVDYQ